MRAQKDRLIVTIQTLRVRSDLHFFHVSISHMALANASQADESACAAFVHLSSHSGRLSRKLPAQKI